MHRVGSEIANSDADAMAQIFSIPVVAGTTYEIPFALYYTAASDTNQIKLQFGGITLGIGEGQSPLAGRIATPYNNSSAPVVATRWIEDDDVFGGVGQARALTAERCLRGMVCLDCQETGNLTLGFAPGTDESAITVGVGSFAVPRANPAIQILADDVLCEDDTFNTLFQVTIEAGKTYLIRTGIKSVSSNTSTGLRRKWTGLTGGATCDGAGVHGSGSNSPQVVPFFIRDDTAITQTHAGGLVGHEDCMLVRGGSENFTLTLSANRHAFTTGTATAQARSFLSIREIDPDDVVQLDPPTDGDVPCTSNSIAETVFGKTLAAGTYYHWLACIGITTSSSGVGYARKFDSSAGSFVVGLHGATGSTNPSTWARRNNQVLTLSSIGMGSGERCDIEESVVHGGAGGSNYNVRIQLGAGETGTVTAKGSSWALAEALELAE